MPNPKSGDALGTKILRQLKELQETVMELLDDARAGREIRQMFLARGTRSRSSTESVTRTPTRVRSGRKQRGRSRTRRSGSQSSELAQKILEVFSSAKKGLKARELKEQLPEVAAGSLTYQLEKLVKTKKLRRRGKTSKTTYYLATA